LVGQNPSGDPAIYNARVLKIYNATNSLARFQRVKIIFLRNKNALTYYNAGVAAVNSKVVGLAPGRGKNISGHFKYLALRRRCVNNVLH
jgi:hypothetical protein